MGVRIGVLSDTHLLSVTREIREIYTAYLQDCDFIVHAGDLVSLDILSFLSKKKLFAVHGNMDPPEVVAQLPRKTILDAGACRLGLIHGWGSSRDLEERIRNEFTSVDGIIYGHSHCPVQHERQGVLFFNPGTATGYMASGIHSLGILEVDEDIRGRIVEV